MDVTQIQNLTIHKAAKAELATLWALCERMGVAKDVDYFDRSFEYQDAGEREVLIASLPEGAVGYCFLSWQPKYAFYRKLEIPEIQDLNVIPEYRRRGIATAMIAFCEGQAREKGYEHIGLGVGLDASFGPAQRLYVRLGYVPDGNGLTYDRKLVAAGEMRVVDENLCLMLVKSLK